METRLRQLEAELEALRKELQAAHEKQRRGDEAFRRFSDSGIMGIALFDLSGKILFANEALLKMIGCQAEDVTAGKVRWDLLTPPEWTSRAAEALEELKTTGSCAPHEREYQRGDGTRFWGLFTGAMAGDQNAAAFLLDVTERIQAEQERERSLVREQEARARAEEAQRRLGFLAEASRILSSSLDYQTTLDQVARLAVPILADWCDIRVVDETGAIRRVAVMHSDAEKVALADELDRLYPLDPNDPRGVAQVLRTGQPEFYPEIPDELLVSSTRDEEHLRIARALGLKSALVMPLTARGRTLGVLTLVYAESDRRYTDEQIALAEDLARRAGTAIDNARLYAGAQSAVQRHETVEQKLTLLTEATGTLISSLNLDRVLAEILVLSRRLVAADAYAIWRLDRAAGGWVITAAEGLSEQYQSAVIPAPQESQWIPSAPLVVADVEQDPLLAEHRGLVHQKEGIRSMLVSPLLMHGAFGGTLVLYYRQPHTFDDIELKVSKALANLAASVIATAELYQAASQRADQLEEADRLKDQFLAMLAHELRNPLNAICSAIQVIHRAPADAPAFQRARAVVDRQSQHMARLVDQLLEVSRISSGRIDLHPRRLDLAALVHNTCEDHRRLLEAARLSLAVELPEAPLWVDGDPTRLRQTLGNLLQNAAKFSNPGGHVTVRAGVKSEEGMATVTVTDNGIGIPPELLPNLFEPFVQADRSLDRTQGGLGLGLTLVKGIAELHGGRVHAHSEGIGRGATFAFEIPLQPPLMAEDQLPSPAGISPETLRVLIIEDNADAADTLRDLLELSGHQVAVAYSGAAGLEMARSIRPDVVLCDLGLPGMDGYAVAAALRGDPATAAACLIAISGYGREEDIQRSSAVGFDAHLTKPIEPEILEQTLSDTVRAARRSDRRDGRALR